MQINEFPIFQTLLNDVHTKAFGEPLSRLPHGKAQALSWFIEEATGQILSYKTLSNYAGAVLQKTPENINPSTTTLAILVHYLRDEMPDSSGVAWYRYRGQVLRNLAA